MFAVPSSEHWKFLAYNTKDKNIGQLIDEAMDAIVTANPELVGTFSQIYTTVDQPGLGELVELLGSVRFSLHGRCRAWPDGGDGQVTFWEISSHSKDGVAANSSFHPVL